MKPVEFVAHGSQMSCSSWAQLCWLCCSWKLFRCFKKGFMEEQAPFGQGDS